MEGIQEEDPSDQEAEEGCERVSYSGSGDAVLTGYTMGPYTRRYSSCTTG